MKVITFGELMLRLAPEGYLRFVQADRFAATFGGAEANVAVSLAQFGVDAAFVSKLPPHEIGQLAVDSLRRYGVDTSLILRGGARVGVYYVEKGASQRASKVVYDRVGSSVATASRGEFDWQKILAGADWFHFTGITPALSDELAAACLDACRACRAAGITVSCDPNYRKNLWSLEKAGSTLRELMPYVDVLIANEGQAADLFGIRATGSGTPGVGKPDPESCTQVAAALAQEFGCRQVALTMRTSRTASDNDWSAMLYSGGKSYFAREYPVHIVDRVGGGDGFCAGLIYALREGDEAQEAIEFATAAACLKHAVEGDYNLVSVEEVRALADGDGSGRVQR